MKEIKEKQNQNWNLILGIPSNICREKWNPNIKMPPNELLRYKVRSTVTINISEGNERLYQNFETDRREQKNIINRKSYKRKTINYILSYWNIST